LFGRTILVRGKVDSQWVSEGFSVEFSVRIDFPTEKEPVQNQRLISQAAVETLAAA
jgi:hypothetical protein